MKSYNVMNLTSMDMTWRDPYNLVSEHFWLKIMLPSLIVSVLIVGTVLHGGIILYERFSGDPRKRGLVNQLISHVSTLTLTMYWMNTPLLMWRILIGPVTGLFWWFWWFISTCYAYSIGLTALEYLLVKYYSIMIAKRMLPILDDFIAKFLAMGNLSMGIVFGIINCHTEEGFQTEMRSAGLPPLMANYQYFRPKLLGSFLGSVFLLYFILNIHLQCRIHAKQKSLDHDQGSSDQDLELDSLDGNVDVSLNNIHSMNGFILANINTAANGNIGNNLNMINTSAYNTETVATSSMIFAGIVGTFAGISSSLGNLVEFFPGGNLKLFVYFMGDMTHVFTMMVLVPVAFVIGNSEMASFMKRFGKSRVDVSYKA